MPLHYTLIRQPYRITHARWNFTVIQKRIMTLIISRLQKEIALVEQGISPEDLDIFRSGTDTLTLPLSLSDLVRNQNNYSHVKEALRQLQCLNPDIVLPATRSKKAKEPQPEAVLRGLIAGAEMPRNGRTLTLELYRDTVLELIRVSGGFTVVAREVLLGTVNRHTQKIYELLCHWMDLTVWQVSVEKFRKLLAIEGKYPKVADLIRYVVQPAQKELSEMGDVYFKFDTAKSSGIITHFLFRIQQRRKPFVPRQNPGAGESVLSHPIRGFQHSGRESVFGISLDKDALIREAMQNDALCRQCPFRQSSSCLTCLTELQSPLERRLFVELKKAGIPFEVQWALNWNGERVQLLGPYGSPENRKKRILTVVDFYIEAVGIRLCVYTDGHNFHERNDDQVIRDENINRRLDELGFKVLRFPGKEICEKMHRVMRAIKRKITLAEA